MAKAKQLNVPMMEKLIKELNAFGELIKVKQDEKQSVIDDFEKEKGRYRGGKISETALVSSSAKTNKELMKLDNMIRNTIAKFKGLGDQLKKLASNQSPRVFRAHVFGVSPASKKSKGKAKKKAGKKAGKKKSVKAPGLRAVMKREKALDRKYQK